MVLLTSVAAGRVTISGHDKTASTWNMGSSFVSDFPKSSKFVVVHLEF